MGLLDDGREIAHFARVIGILQQQAERAIQRQRVRIADLDADIERQRAPLDHVEGLRERFRRHQEHALLARRRLLRVDPVEHRHGFGRGRAFVEQRRRRDLHRGQVAHHRLEVDERLEASLRDLGLIRRIRRVPAGVLEHVAQDHGRRVAIVVAHADVPARDAVLRRDAPQPSKIPGLGLGGRQIQRLGEANAGRDRLIDERVDRGHADGAQHLVLRAGVGSDVAILEAAVVRDSWSEIRLHFVSSV
jgi:hypothetical protein